MNTRYQPTKDGFEINDGAGIFNRALYGGHKNDHLRENSYTYAGDKPVAMAAITNGHQFAQCGTLMLGTATTPGKCPHFQQVWLHKEQGITAIFRNGWMEYRVSPNFYTITVTEALVEIYPLLPEDGFAFHIRARTDQRIHLTAAFGAPTTWQSLSSLYEPRVMLFHPQESVPAAAKVKNGIGMLRASHQACARSYIKGNFTSHLQVGATAPFEMSVGDAAQITKFGPSGFLENTRSKPKYPVLRMSCVIEPGKPLDAWIFVVRDADKEMVEPWLSCPNPAEVLEKRIRAKHSFVDMKTPDKNLDLTLPSNVLAMDECWQKPVFHHGAVSWHNPFLGWRNWYGPTVLGWHDRVAECFGTFAKDQRKKGKKPEQVVFDGLPYGKRPHPITNYHTLKNTYGNLPCLPGDKYNQYNMQEVGVDMILHHLEWTGDLEYARKVFPVVNRILDWQERLLDPDHDGLYQNFLNTWCSDAHHYNGGGCTQSSAYNYRANRVMATVANLLGKDSRKFAKRAEKIRNAVSKELWVKETGTVAEYVDTVGNRLLHPSPELASIYHAAESGVLDPFQMYQMLRFTETGLQNHVTELRKGRVVLSSAWLPRRHSNCGLYTGENVHLAWSYFRLGLADKGWDILRTVVDGHFATMSPGSCGHILSENGYSKSIIDFSDPVSMYLRTLVEGLYGIRVDLLNNEIEIAPQLPKSWHHAQLTLPLLSYEYRRDGQTQTLAVTANKKAKRILRLRMSGTKVKKVLLNGKPAAYSVQAGMGRSDIVVTNPKPGKLKLEVTCTGSIPSLSFPSSVKKGSRIALSLRSANLVEISDPQQVLEKPRIGKGSLQAQTNAQPGWHTFFVLTEKDDYKAWHVVDFQVTPQRIILPPKPQPASKFVPVDIHAQHNIALADIHEQEYWRPRPKGYSIGAALNGRSGWDHTHTGHNTPLLVDDSALRQNEGHFSSPSGIRFQLASRGPNAACAAIWENFPEEIRIPLSGKGKELAILFVGVTNFMQTELPNAVFEVEYADAARETKTLIYPHNIDDWLVPALQRENESVQFSPHNHAIVQRIPLNPKKKLAALSVKAIANEVIVGVMGVSIA